MLMKRIDEIRTGSINTSPFELQQANFPVHLLHTSPLCIIDSFKSILTDHSLLKPLTPLAISTHYSLKAITRVIHVFGTYPVIIEACLFSTAANLRQLERAKLDFFFLE